MAGLSVELMLIVICSLVVLSYLFSIISRFIRVPSVLLLLFAGIGFRMITDAKGIVIDIPQQVVEGLGVVGLIMIVLEAGLDLKLGRNKVKVIRDSFFAALVIFVISAAFVTAILHYALNEPWINCLVYAIPLSIMSSSIVIPSIHALSRAKQEFSVYEASFSDILGILVFNYFTANQVVTGMSLAIFGGNIIVSIILSLLLSFILFLILTKTKLNIKFFLIFSLLILIYSGGKLLHLPSLLIILVFGLLINNWEKIPVKKLVRFFPASQVDPLRDLLHSVTAETSFIVRTFFFLLFGFSMQLDFFSQKEVWQTGGTIVLALFVVRLLYLRFFMKTNIFPETFFIPRGLITIVLFYKIPENFKLTSFNDDILLFIILTTSLIMMMGMIFYKKTPEHLVEETQFAERQPQ